MMKNETATGERSSRITSVAGDMDGLHFGDSSAVGKLTSV